MIRLTIGNANPGCELFIIGIRGMVKLLNFIAALLLCTVLGCFAAAQDAIQTPDTILIDSAMVAPDGSLPLGISNLIVRDNPNDDGNSIWLVWDKSPDDDLGKITSYVILRAESREGEYSRVGDVSSGTTEFFDNGAVDGVEYYYKIAAVNSLHDNGRLQWEVQAQSDSVGPVRSSAQWFDMRRFNVFIGVIFLCSAILYYISKARTGKELFIRKIAGLDSVDEAVGRATEMGRKIFYVPGISDMDNVQTIAGVTILGRVAQLAAEYETWIEVPVCKSLVMVTAKEIVKEAYVKAGRPDAFNDNQVHYLTDDQFGYAAAIDGMIVREKPATIFYMGSFYAESLIMAETGNAAGAIQIAGTGQASQLPFFVAACDYTLIGEELFAASAYLSKEPKLLGSLKGQDMGKAAILIFIILGLILESFNIFQMSNWFSVR